MDKRDAIAPMHPFPERSLAAVLVRALDRALPRARWRFTADAISWTADRTDGVKTLHVEDRTQHGGGLVLTALDGEFRHVLRCPADTTIDDLQRLVGGLVVLDVLPEQGYFS